MERSKPKVLIVDDDKNTREGMARGLKRDYEVRTAESAETAIALLNEEPADVMLTDLCMPGADGLALLAEVRAMKSPPACILLTAYGSVETAVDAMKHGAFDFLTKPVDLLKLDALIKRALAANGAEISAAREKRKREKQGLSAIVGSSESMKPVFELIRQTAPSQATVLVTGPSGAGKELVARAIHDLSTRRDGPFITVHCAALAPSLLESELFGHEKGAFTGADSLRRGRFELANGGTLFLDEIGEIDPAIQVKLLRVLEDKRFERVGGTTTIESDARLIAATNRDLAAAVRDGTFREDLFYRLNVINIALPSLAERRDDIPALIAHFLKTSAARNERKTPRLSPEAMTLLCSYKWPGNVRELRNVIERLVVLSPGKMIEPQDLPILGALSATSSAALPASAEVIVPPTRPRTGDDLIDALRATNGRRGKAAAMLGISERTLRRRLIRYREEGKLPEDLQ